LFKIFFSNFWLKHFVPNYSRALPRHLWVLANVQAFEDELGERDGRGREGARVAGVGHPVRVLQGHLGELESILGIASLGRNIMGDFKPQFLG
jgi:hypothetical protein